jgi:hypothetical protein
VWVSSRCKTALLSFITFPVGGVSMFLNGWHSDHTGERSYHVIATAVIGASEFMLLAQASRPAISIFALSLAAISAHGYLPAFWEIPPVVLSMTPLRSVWPQSRRWGISEISRTIHRWSGQWTALISDRGDVAPTHCTLSARPSSLRRCITSPYRFEAYNEAAISE